MLIMKAISLAALFGHALFAHENVTIIINHYHYHSRCLYNLIGEKGTISISDQQFPCM